MSKVQSYRVYTIRDTRKNVNKKTHTFHNKKLAQEFADGIFKELVDNKRGMDSGCVVIEPAIY